MPMQENAGARTARSTDALARRDVAALSIWALLIAASTIVAVVLAARGIDVRVDAPPLFAKLAPSVRIGALLPIAVATAIVAGATAAKRALSFGWLLVAAFGASLAWAVSLACTVGLHTLTHPLLDRHDYLVNLPRVTSPGTLLADFTTEIRRFTTHVRGHPPGLLLALVGLDRLSLATPGIVAGLVIAAGAAAAPAAMVALRAAAGTAAARAAAPVLVLAPGAIWVATSADGLYLGMSAWAVALGVAGFHGGTWRARAAAAAGGVLFGLALHLSYGVAPLGAIVLMAAARRRALAQLAWFAVGAAAVTAVFLSAGFWWFDGLAATRELYEAGLARHRPQAYFLLGNLGAFAVSIGPAAAVALARLRRADPGAWLLVGGALVAVAASNLSGLSRGEVERIWLPFTPWILAAGVTLDARRWLVLQAAWTIGLELLLRTPW